MRFFLFLWLVVSLTGCCHLYVRNEFITTNHLASCAVETPDWRKCSPYCGQHLIIGWFFPLGYMRCNDLHLLVTMRMRNQSLIEITVPVKRQVGKYVYCCMNEAYQATCGGILTYKIEVLSGCRTLETWTHQIWTELITIEE